MTIIQNTTELINASNLCIISPSSSSRVSESSSIRLSDLIELIKPSVKNIFLITNLDSTQDLPSQGNVYLAGKVQSPDAGSPIFSMVVGELRAQLQIAKWLRSLPDEVDLILWRGRSSTFVIPLILARLKGKKSILFIESKGSELVREVYTGKFSLKGLILTKIYDLVENINCFNADKLVVNVPGLLEHPWLTKYDCKVFPFPVAMRFIDTSFRVICPLNDRKTIIGYIGRMSYEKGVLNLAKAIPQVYDQIKHVSFLIGGEGPLLHQIEDELSHIITQGHAELRGWIPHDTLPEHLNEIKLLVLPSSYEGLPTIVLEAMACGAVVLASPVGAVPDIISDGKTGFIMENNSPECIVRNIIRALNHPDFEQISLNGQALVESNYRYSILEKRYRELITGLVSRGD